MRLWIRPILILTVAGTVWVLVTAFVSNPFARGMVAGGLVGAGLLLGALLLLTGRLRKKRGTQLQPPPLPVRRWDYDMRVTALDGSPVDFGSFEGRVVVLNFWATWCAPCVAELPSLRRLADETADLDVALACVTRESADVVGPFLRKRGLDVPAYALDGDPPQAFSTRAIPATFVIDREGAIALRHMGAAAWDDPKVVEFVRRLANSPAISA